MNFYFAGKEVHRFFPKCLVAIMTFVFLVPLAIIASPVWIPANIILKNKGRKGFYRDKQIKLDFDAFHLRA